MKGISLILVILLILASMVSCSGKKGIPPKPEDTNLEFWITQDVSKIDFSDYHEILGVMGAKEYYGYGYLPAHNDTGFEIAPEYYVKYTLTPWPDYADGGQYITTIEFCDPKVTVYGLTVDSSFDDFEQVFQDMAYELTMESSDYLERYTASKNGISFSLENANGKRTFTINAEVTNKQGIEY